MIQRLVLLFILLASSTAGAAIRYVSTTGIGSGDCTTTGTACTRERAMAVAVAGDTIRFRPGTYTNWTEWVFNKSGTANARLTIESETMHGAILQLSTAGNGGGFRMQNNSYITIRGFKVDGGTGTSVYGCIGTDGSAAQTGLIVENNWCRKMGTLGIYMGKTNTSNWIVRWNLVDGTGYNTTQPTAESFYIGTSSVPAVNFGPAVLYGNTVRDCVAQAFDVKDSAYDVNVHHNLVEDCADVTAGGRITNDGTTGLATYTGELNYANNRINNNIFRNPLSRASAMTFWRGSGTFDSNVIYNSRSNVAAIYFYFDQPTMLATNNTTCSTTTTYTDTDGAPLTGVLTGTLFNQAQGACDAEVTRITDEIAARPTIASAEIGLIANNKIRVTLTNQSTAAIDGAAMVGNTTLIASVNHAACTLSGMTPSRTITGSSVVGTNIIDFTLSGDGDSDDVPLLSCTAGAIVNTGAIGATWISDQASTAAITNQAVTNNIEGAAPAHVLSQTAFRFTRENNQISTNTSITLQPGSTLLVEVQVDGTVANPPPLGMQLRYSTNGSDYFVIPDEFDGDNIKFISNSVIVPFIAAEGTPITSCLSGALAVINGAVQRTSNAVPSVDLAQDGCVVNGYGIVFDTDATPSTQYRFRAYNQTGVALDNYTSQGVATIGQFPGVEAGTRSAASGRAAATGRTQAGARAQVVQ